MSCSCRTSALRAFVKSIAQIHLPETAVGRTPWQSRRSLLGVSRGGNFPSLALATWSRSFHSTIRNYSQSDTETPLYQLEDADSEEKRDRLSAHTGAPIAELSHEALDVLAAEINAAEAARSSSQIPMTKPEGKRAQTGAGRRMTTSDVALRMIRDRSAQSKIPWKQKERRTSTKDLPRTKEEWQIQKAALKEKFPEGWQPRKKLSPDALAGIRALHAQFPEDYTTEILANKFEVSPEAIRRILKSKWEPTAQEDEKRQERWFNRGKQVWSRWAELGKKPPTKWRDEGIERKPYRRQRYDDEMGDEEDGLSETGNNRLIARSKLAKNLM